MIIEETTMNSHKMKTRLISTTLVLLSVLVWPVRAQMTVTSADEPQTWAGLIAQEGDWADVITGVSVPEGLVDIDFLALTRDERKQFRANILKTLRSERGAEWEEAARQVIYLSFFYRDWINFDRATVPLLEGYMFDRNEDRRIMALAALHAIGHGDTMGYLGQHVKLERSPRVRRLAIAALADHYGIRDFYMRDRSAGFNPPTPVIGK